MTLKSTTLISISTFTVFKLSLCYPGKLTPADMQGGTFTISNGGVFGSLLSMPIINLPQSAILGMHSIQQRPVAVNGKVLYTLFVHPNVTNCRDRRYLFIKTIRPKTIPTFRYSHDDTRSRIRTTAETKLFFITNINFLSKIASAELPL